MLPLTVFALPSVLSKTTIPVIAEFWLKLVLALAIDRSRTVLFDIVVVPLVTLMPMIKPSVLGVVLVVEFTMLAMVLPEMVTVPAPVFCMPATV